MKKHSLRYRQVHLDFHTSGVIENIGKQFSKEQFQAMLKKGHVDSVTVFSKCHHGLSYHPTKVGAMHPHLSFDLLDEQIKACREIDVKCPIYLSAGVDQYATYEHPEWRVVIKNGKCCGWVNGSENSAVTAGYHVMCFNSPYLDYLCAQIREVVEKYPDADGIFLDIVGIQQCYCPHCIKSMRALGLDPEKDEDVLKHSHIVLEKYLKATCEAAKVTNPDIPIFHNGGNIVPGGRHILKYFSHLEIESLPTGGWGYDHFPLSAKYVEQLGFDYLGMTGKFNTSWGEFGGFKHPNALRYECAAMIANGARCSIGDQGHPELALDETTYSIIGAAYEEVEKKEPWCVGTKNVADVGLLLVESQNYGITDKNKLIPIRHTDIGASRVLLEEHILFDALDMESDFNKYKLLVIPELLYITPELKERLDTYVANGGKLLFAGKSAFDKEGKNLMFDIGAEYEGESEYPIDFVLPKEEYRSEFQTTPYVMYTRPQRIRVTTGESLGDIYDPYFNRSFNHFSSHQHTPNLPTPSGYACGVMKGNIAYLAHKSFIQYYVHGWVVYRKFIGNVIKKLLGNSTVEFTNLPSSARFTYRSQPAENRNVLHLLYAEKSLRGNWAFNGDCSGGQTAPREVIEDISPIYNIGVRVKAENVKSIRLALSSEELAFTAKDGWVEFTVPKVECHEMVEINF